MPLLPLLLLPSLLAPHAEGGDVVSLVRENYVGYEEARREIDPHGDRRLGESPVEIEGYLRLWSDPQLVKIARDSEPFGRDPAFRRELIRAVFSCEHLDRPLPTRRIAQSELSALTNLARSGASVVLDLRYSYGNGPWRLADTVAALPYVVNRRSVLLAGEERRVGSDAAAIWRPDTNAVAGEDGAGGLKKVMPGSPITTVPSRTLPLKPRPCLKRIALLINATTTPEGIRFVALVREDPRVRILGSPTGSPTFSPRNFQSGGRSSTVQIPTARLIGLPLPSPTRTCVR